MKAPIHRRFVIYLFAVSAIRCKKTVALAVDGGGSAPSNGIHFPVSVVIVHHMEVPVSAPAFSKTSLNPSTIKTPVLPTTSADLVASESSVSAVDGSDSLKHSYWLELTLSNNS